MTIIAVVRTVAIAPTVAAAIKNVNVVITDYEQNIANSS